jgi:hypothetical protein
MIQMTPTATPGLAGLWILLVNNDGELKAQDHDCRVPVMASP